MREYCDGANHVSDISISRITSCLGARDLVNVCQAFKSWNFLLKRPKIISKLEEHLKQNANFLDEELCELLDSNKLTFINPSKALSYYISTEEKGPPTLSTSSLTIIFDIFERNNDPADDRECWEQITFAKCIFLDQNPLAKEEIEKVELVIYAVDTPTPKTAKFQELCDLLKPQQKLLIVRFRQLEDGMEKLKLDCMYECYNSLSKSLKFIGDIKWIITFSERPPKDVLAGKLAIIWTCFDLCQNYFVFPPAFDKDQKLKKQ
ncbi:hypothetical protein ACTXT7_004533 [Hymenolepis weldensis]